MRNDDFEKWWALIEERAKRNIEAKKKENRGVISVEDGCLLVMKEIAREVLYRSGIE